MKLDEQFNLPVKTELLLATAKRAQDDVAVPLVERRGGRAD